MEIGIALIEDSSVSDSEDEFESEMVSVISKIAMKKSAGSSYMKKKNKISL